MGQLLSSSKCPFLFSDQCPKQVRTDIKGVLEVEITTFESKYMGLPTPEGRMKDELPISYGQTWERCNNWNGRFMSYAAKEVHVKSLVQTLPSFTMGVFLLLKGF